MAKKNKKSGAQKPAAGVPTTAAIEASKKPAPHPSARGGRETVDALVVAFVLAFLIRTFQAEAFVIPTGSMAPTLMGRHKDVYCEQCDCRYRVNSSDDAADAAQAYSAQVRRGMISRRKVLERLAGLSCAAGVCPNCRYVMPLDDKGVRQYVPEESRPVEKEPDYSGDRLVVSKYAYEFADPERWDVIVFKYPGNTQTNYIKRLVGLPGEELRIFQGDLYLRSTEGAEASFAIEQKPAKQVLAMRQLVHDTDHDPVKLHEAGWPLRWSADDDAWHVETTPEGKRLRQAYRANAPGEDTHWLRYRHTPPSEAVWRRVLDNPSPAEFEPPPSLVTDFTPYNTRINSGHVQRAGGYSLQPVQPGDFGRLGVHWVGDLMLEADVRLESPAGELSLELTEAGEHHGVTIDVATGEARLWRRGFESGEISETEKASTPLRGEGSWRVMLANVDGRLLLWVNGELVQVDGDFSAGDDASGPAATPRTSAADPGDLAPVAIGLAGGEATVERLRVWRDGYYIASRWDEQELGFTTDFAPESIPRGGLAAWTNWFGKLASSPAMWGAFADRRKADFRIDEGQLFVLGDNSGWSLDARLWAGGNGRDRGKPGGPYLESSQLVGKAICVYWPHAWYSVPFTNRVVPAWPNLGDMRLVR